MKEKTTARIMIAMNLNNNELQSVNFKDLQGKVTKAAEKAQKKK